MLLNVILPSAGPNACCVTVTAKLQTTTPKMADGVQVTPTGVTSRPDSDAFVVAMGVWFVLVVWRSTSMRCVVARGSTLTVMTSPARSWPLLVSVTTMLPARQSVAPGSQRGWLDAVTDTLLPNARMAFENSWKPVGVVGMPGPTKRAAWLEPGT